MKLRHFVAIWMLDRTKVLLHLRIPSLPSFPRDRIYAPNRMDFNLSKVYIGDTGRLQFQERRTTAEHLNWWKKERTGFMVGSDDDAVETEHSIQPFTICVFFLSRTEIPRTALSLDLSSNEPSSRKSKLVDFTSSLFYSFTHVAHGQCGSP